jgi:hypothetical protein
MSMSGCRMASLIFSSGYRMTPFPDQVLKAA